MYPLIAFDLDGTLIDSLGDLCLAVNRMVSELGGRPLACDAVGRMVGEGAALLVSRACDAAGLAVDARQVLPRFLEIYDSLLPGQTVPYEGIPQLLAELRPSHRLVVLTNKPGGATRKLLEDLELASFFDEVIGGDGPCRRKPDPEGLRHLIEQAGVRPDQALLVGDSTVDLLTARAAGTQVCIARYGFGQATFDVSALCGSELFIDAPLGLLAHLGSRQPAGPARMDPASPLPAHSRGPEWKEGRKA